MSRIADNLQDVHARIANAAKKVSRAEQEIQLLAVSKTFGASAVLEAVAAGQRSFGENYVQEAVDKIVEVQKLQALHDTQSLQNRSTQTTHDVRAKIEWHFIGPIQSNKTRAIAENFDWVHTVDREKIAARLDAQRPVDRAPLNVCIQVNISNESSKSGVAPQDVLTLAKTIQQLPNLRLRGLMAIPESLSELEAQRAPFKALKNLQVSLWEQGLALDTLSMGMSSDLDAAILEGATIVRIGSAIFGHRTRKEHHANAS